MVSNSLIIPDGCIAASDTMIYLSHYLEFYKLTTADTCAVLQQSGNLRVVSSQMRSEN